MRACGPRRSCCSVGPRAGSCSFTWTAMGTRTNAAASSSATTMVGRHGPARMRCCGMWPMRTWRSSTVRTSTSTHVSGAAMLPQLLPATGRTSRAVTTTARTATRRRAAQIRAAPRLALVAGCSMPTRWSATTTSAAQCGRYPTPLACHRRCRRCRPSRDGVRRTGSRSLCPTGPESGQLWGRLSQWPYSTSMASVPTPDLLWGGRRSPCSLRTRTL
mmetsp:Transcript_21047/g.47372  ORF Transcript_21047/g.47372 Transcript_21047/m.47372 type:complete len:217 (-) Transcript_21047:502-1152(-)